jgi:hypothetical protein
VTSSVDIYADNLCRMFRVTPRTLLSTSADNHTASSMHKPEYKTNEEICQSTMTIDEADYLLRYVHVGRQ